MDEHELERQTKSVSVVLIEEALEPQRCDSPDILYRLSCRLSFNSKH